MITSRVFGSVNIHLDNDVVMSQVFESLAEYSYDNMPKHIQAIIDRYDHDNLDYDKCRQMEAELNEHDWECDWGLDAVPFGFKPKYGDA